MLALAWDRHPVTEPRAQWLEVPLPEGPMSLLHRRSRSHHLDTAGRADLLRRADDRLRPGGRVVMADVVIPDDPHDGVTPGVPPRQAEPSRRSAQLAPRGRARPTLRRHEKELVVSAGDA